MQPAPVVLYAERNLRVEYFRTSQPTSRLLFTFTEHGNRALDGLGYAGKFALENGFDLVSVKSSLDDWYASLPAEVRAARGLSDSLVRLSVGVEDLADLIADLDQALDRSLVS